MRIPFTTGACVALTVVGVLAGCANHASSPEDSSVISEMRSQRNIGPSALVDALANADVVLLGETHDDPEHHRLQAWIADQLVARGRRIAVAYEMIDDSQAPLLARFLAARPRDAAGLGDALSWSNSGWPDWSLYRPIADVALTQPAPPAKPLRAANLPTSQMRDIARNGLKASGLDTALAAMLRQAQARDPAVMAAHAEDIRQGHCGMLPDSAITPFALAQYARDIVMARSIVAARAEDPDAAVLLIAGAGHARKDVGVPVHLARLLPKARIVSVGFLEDDDETATRSAAPFDYVWETPAIERDDPCTALTQPVR
jgi:uncharacterized iron-regulated protein